MVQLSQTQRMKFKPPILVLSCTVPQNNNPRSTHVKRTLFQGAKGSVVPPSSYVRFTMTARLGKAPQRRVQAPAERGAVGGVSGSCVHERKGSRQRIRGGVRLVAVRVGGVLFWWKWWKWWRDGVGCVGSVEVWGRRC